MKYDAIVVAGGVGKRADLGFNKVLYRMRDGKTVLNHSCLNFINDDDCQKLIVVCNFELDFKCDKLVTVPGGKERYESVLNGLNEVTSDYVLIHDGARPFLTQEIIDRICREVLTEKACAVGMPVKDTIKITDTEGYVASTPDRRTVWQVQTPQAFDLNLIREAYQNWEDSGEKNGFCITDDAGMVERFTEQKVKMVEGSYRNIKITTPEDLEIGERFLS